MARFFSLIVLALMAFACTAAPAATERPTDPPAVTPLIIYVTPEPQPTLSLTPGASSAAATASPRPALSPLAAHVIATLDALERESDRLVAASNAGGGPDIYFAILAIQRLADEELGWLSSIDAAEPLAASTLETYRNRLATLKGHVDTIISEWVGDPPAGDYDGPAAEEGGAAMAALYAMRSQLRALSGDYTVVAVPTLTATPTTPATPVAVDVDFEELKETIRDLVEDELEFFISRVQKVTVSADEIYVEYGDNNWVKSILRRNQWTAVEAIADEIYGYDDYWGNIAPSLRIRSTSGLGGGSLTSVTSAAQLRQIYELELSESDWYRQAKFTVRGKLY